MSLLLASAVCGAEGAILRLTEQNFTAVVNASGAAVLVEFFAPWCSFCKSLEPEYKRAGKLLAQAVDIDATITGKLAAVDQAEALA